MAEDKVERQKMEMGGSGTAKVSFKDALGGDVKIKSSTWSSTGAVAVSPDEKDPATAKLFASGPGPSTITAVGQTESGSSATATVEVMVIEKDTPVEGKIELSVQAAPAKKEPAKTEHPAAR
jgi:sugar (pentulose or hexulose) kinase